MQQISRGRSCIYLVLAHLPLCYVGGDDSKIRLWSIKTGSLLRTIAHEDYCCEERKDEAWTPLTLCFTNNLGSKTNPALLIASTCINSKNTIETFQL